MNPARDTTAATATAVVLATAGGLLSAAATTAAAAVTCTSPVYKRQFFARRGPGIRGPFIVCTPA
jgi:hypothetical protein